jgi:hypothetical protein
LEFTTRGFKNLKDKHLVVRIFSNWCIAEEEGKRILNLHGALESSKPLRVIFNKSGPADLVIVLNTVKKFRWVVVPAGRVYKILQEPELRLWWSHLFTYKHERYFDRIYTHTPNSNDSRVRVSPGMPVPFINFVSPVDRWREKKTRNLSIISSTADYLLGHNNRNRFVTDLIKLRPELGEDLYGRGRDKHLVEKSEGLASYRFSLAVENSVLPNYVTEKFLDCIMHGTVPLYYGAPNVSEYFPPGSFIEIPIDNLQESLKIIDSLSEADYISRIPDLQEAVSIIKSGHDLGGFIVFESSQPVPRTPQKFILLFRTNGLVLFISETLLEILSHLPHPLVSRMKSLLANARAKLLVRQGGQ